MSSGFHFSSKVYYSFFQYVLDLHLKLNFSVFSTISPQNRPYRRRYLGKQGKPKLFEFELNNLNVIYNKTLMH